MFFQGVLGLSVQYHPDHSSLYVPFVQAPVYQPLGNLHFVYLPDEHLLVPLNEYLHELERLLLPKMALQQFKNGIKDLNLLLLGQVDSVLTIQPRQQVLDAHDGKRTVVYVREQNLFMGRGVQG